MASDQSLQGLALNDGLGGPGSALGNLDIGSYEPELEVGVNGNSNS